jgi:hypothetical protein
VRGDGHAHRQAGQQHPKTTNDIQHCSLPNTIIFCNGTLIIVPYNLARYIAPNCSQMFSQQFQ